jgi:LytS/YehU family sensor histidine kinase
MIFLFVGIPVLGLLFFFAAGIRGIMGAIILGVSTVSADLLWQWLRLTLDRKLGPKYLLGIVLVGFVMRLVSMIGFLKIAETALKTDEFYLAAAFLLCILFSQKILALIISWKEEKSNAPK